MLGGVFSSSSFRVAMHRRSDVSNAVTVQLVPCYLQMTARMALANPLDSTSQMGIEKKKTADKDLLFVGYKLSRSPAETRERNSPGLYCMLDTPIRTRGRNYPRNVDERVIWTMLYCDGTDGRNFGILCVDLGKALSLLIF